MYAESKKRNDFRFKKFGKSLQLVEKIPIPIDDIIITTLFKALTALQ